MKYDDFIDELYNTVVGNCSQLNLKTDEEINKRDDELLKMISDAMTEKYGLSEATGIINEQFDTQCIREHPCNIAIFKMSIQIGFMFAKLLNELENI